MNKIIKRLIIIGILIIAGIFTRGSKAYAAEVNAYYLGSKDTAKATEYTNAIDKNFTV